MDLAGAERTVSRARAQALENATAALARTLGHLRAAGREPAACAIVANAAPLAAAGRAVGKPWASAGESVDIMAPLDAEGAQLKPGQPGSDAYLFDRARGRIAVEICYCSRLGDCWTLRSGGEQESSTVETRRCPSPSAQTFRE
ncbi:MAG TPA: hypothetical protein VI356_04490 [Myxococcales bacterium]